MRWQAFFICSSLIVLASGQGITPTVTIEQGMVMGSNSSDGSYFEFYGIPYADSTSGTHRFKAPLPPPSFQDVFFANRRDIKCVRALGVGYEGTEDCLVANVMTPTLSATARLPVMVWIKGREFDKVYEHDLSFKNFMAQEVIVVSLNYRESILGFLCLGTETAPGNAGLKDIIAGLRWVQNNIAQFGGNPNDITLFGHGSGAAAVDLVTLSPLSTNLVQKAIAQSGTATAPWAVSRNNLEFAVQVAEGLGHVVTDVQQLSEVFSRTSVAALMGVINELDLTENALAFAPCVERNDIDGVEPFLVRTPAEILADGSFLQIPFITGFVDNEGTIRAEEAIEDDWLERMDESFVEFLQSDLTFESEEERIEVADYIRQFYFGDESINLANVDDYIAYHGETMILVSSIREARARARISIAPTYLYQFSYKGDLGEPFVGPFEVDAAAHSEELAYMFYETAEGVSARDLTIGDILVERWTNFAKTGNPMSEISPVTWPPFTLNSPFYLRVLGAEEATESTLEVGLMDPHPETVAFWNDIYEDYFLDAESNWELTEKIEGDEEGSGDENISGEGSEEVGDGNGEASGDESGEAGGDGGGEAGGDGNGEAGGDGSGEAGGDGGNEAGGDGNEETDDGGNSASTAVGYTFLIVTLFSFLSKFHSSQLIS